MKHLALRDQILERAGHVLDWHLRIDAMLIQQVDAVGAQTPQLGLDNLPDMIGATVQAPASLACRGIDIEAEFGGHHGAIAQAALQRFAEQFLRHERPIDLGGVEQRDTQIHRTANERDAVLPGGAAGVQIHDPLRATGMPLHPQADGIDLQGPEASPRRGRGIVCRSTRSVGRLSMSRRQPRTDSQCGGGSQKLAAMHMAGIICRHVALLRMLLRQSRFFSAKNFDT